jgi:hypothetical protein
MNDNKLKRIVEYIIEQITDEITGLFIPITIGITNRKGWNIIENPKLTDNIKDHLMIVNKSTIIGCSLKLISIYAAYEQTKLLILTNKLKKSPYCPYCKINDNQYI